MFLSLFSAFMFLLPLYTHFAQIHDRGVKVPLIKASVAIWPHQPYS